VLRLSVVVFLGSDFEVINGHGVEKKLTIREKVKIIQEVEKNPTVS
jgi:hypothetical protein